MIILSERSSNEWERNIILRERKVILGNKKVQCGNGVIL